MANTSGSPYAQRLLEQAVAKHLQPVYMSSKADLIDYYRDKYPGRGANGWKQHIIHDLAAVTGVKPKSLEKRFDEQRRGNPERRNAGQYADLGKQLPPVGQKLKENSFTITVKATQVVGYKNGRPTGERERSIPATFIGADALYFAQNPDYQDFFAYAGYPPDVIEMFFAGDYELDIFQVV